MEQKLYNEYIAIRHQEKPVKRWWFVKLGNQKIDELEPDDNFFFRIIGLRGSRLDVIYH